MIVWACLNWMASHSFYSVANHQVSITLVQGKTSEWRRGKKILSLTKTFSFDLKNRQLEKKLEKPSDVKKINKSCPKSLHRDEHYPVYIKGEQDWLGLGDI